MINCYECKYAQWEARLFATRWTDDQFRVHYHTEQFDCRCVLKNEFFLEYDEPECNDGVLGDNNLLEVCKKNRELIKKYNDVLKRFRKLNEYKEIDEGSDEEFELWIEYLKEREPELYKAFNNEH